ncbi:hypothetical protein BJ993_000383 [Nocardioides aromaticivorans]|uniref:Uncharacterized protein n=1 Tax=Nocardioides aromaticivorans TaxID=200618 RepID=A0A7Z0CLT7_9ACTN|nr:hypothetical protein [Nocardioides aromaticivorans]NYI43303.1 hypothetical protein [Nocardioides aromaticivorans]
MGAKCWMVVYADGPVPPLLRGEPELDEEATADLVARLHPRAALTELGYGDLLENPNPPDREAWAAVYPGVAIVCTSRVAKDRPTDIDPAILGAMPGRTTYVAAMHSVVDWFAYAIWDADGELVRSLSLSPDDGIIEDVGERRAFEAPYWAGEHAEEDDYPLPFHPLDFGEDALVDLFGFCFEGDLPPDGTDVEDVTLLGFRVG